MRGKKILYDLLMWYSKNYTTPSEIFLPKKSMNWVKNELNDAIQMQLINSPPGKSYRKNDIISQQMTRGKGGDCYRLKF